MQFLVIGYGNPGRLDDGLGPAFAERIQDRSLPQVTVESNYQLNIEDAEQIAHFDVVVFADASVSAADPFEFGRMEVSAPMVGFSSHSITPSSLLGLAAHLFKAEPEAYAMAIRGHAFDDFGERLSEKASANLGAAADFFCEWVMTQQGRPV